MWGVSSHLIKDEYKKQGNYEFWKLTDICIGRDRLRWKLTDTLVLPLGHYQTRIKYFSAMVRILKKNSQLRACACFQAPKNYWEKLYFDHQLPSQQNSRREDTTRFDKKKMKWILKGQSSEIVLEFWRIQRLAVKWQSNLVQQFEVNGDIIRYVTIQSMCDPILWIVCFR